MPKNCLEQYHLGLIILLADFIHLLFCKEHHSNFNSPSKLSDIEENKSELNVKPREDIAFDPAFLKENKNLGSSMKSK